MKNTKYKIIAICGKSAVGKDTLQKYLTEKFSDKTHSIISCTTRPRREGESEDAYHFMSYEAFTNEVLTKHMLEASMFNKWFYGTRYQDLDPKKVNVGVFNLQGIENLKSSSEIDCKVVYVSCTDKTRLLRALNRETHPNCKEICRRFMADEDDFAEFNEYDFYVSNENKSEFLTTDWIVDMLWAELDNSN